MNNDNQKTTHKSIQKDQCVPKKESSEEKYVDESPGYDEGVDIGADVTGKALEVLAEESNAGLKPPGKPASPRNPPHSGAED